MATGGELGFDPDLRRSTPVFTTVSEAEEVLRIRTHFLRVAGFGCSLRKTEIT
jgi:hypothetical protein